MGANIHINELIQGRRYYFRACSGNVKGFGNFLASNPTSLIPSTWLDIEPTTEPRFFGKIKILDEIMNAVRLCRPEDATEIPQIFQHRVPKKKTSIKQLFSVTSKFQKNLQKRSIYLASIIFCEDKILVTSEDFIPVIEIDESYPSNFNNDYYWLMKVSF